MAVNKQEMEEFLAAVKSIKGLSAGAQKKAFDTLLKKLEQCEQEKDITQTVKEVFYWVAELC